MRVNSVWRGLYNYFGIADNACTLQRVQYILQYSCLMTLAHKHRLSLPKAIARWGLWPTAKYLTSKGDFKRVTFWRVRGWKKKVHFSTVLDPFDALSRVGQRLTRTSLTKDCIVCGEPGVVMHHVRHLRKGNKTIVNGFNRVMSAINRKQVPLCPACHRKVHRGEYSGIGLCDLAYIPQ
jgi:hypothetical protein